MAYEAAHPVLDSDEGFCPPHLDLQHDMLLTLERWPDAAQIVERLAEAGADLRALSINRQAGGFVLKCRIGAISPSRARAFVADLGDLAAGAASVEHLMLARAL